MAQYRPDNSGATRWLTLEQGDTTNIVECKADSGFDGANSLFGGNLVYAQAGSNVAAFTDDPAREVAWGSFPTSEAYSVYDGNYLNWRANPVPIQMSRIDMVKVAAKITMASINNSNIGIMRFNNTDGGPVIQAMTDLDSNRAALDAVIDGIQAGGRTPLAETLYESALYWLGQPAHYGELINENPTDPAALVSTLPEVYLPPSSPVCTKNYNVLLTDGEPNDDTEAQTLAPTLPDFSTRLGRAACIGTAEGDCLDDIAEYLSTPDYDIDQKGDQFVTTHTIGFTIDLPILKSAADVSGGEYYLADDVESLTMALIQIFNNANEQSLSFTSPAVAVNAFNRTQNLNDLYMTVFKAESKLHWPGNLKKYKIVDRTITDATGLGAVNPLTGFFNDAATSFWTVGGPDGSDVELGGAANVLPAPAARKLYTNNGIDSNLTAASNSLTPSNTAAFTLADFGLSGTAGEPTLDELIRWARGEDVRDEDSDPTTTTRNVMGDPLHAQPAAVVYGGTAGNADVVVYTATNDGYLHAVDGATGVELWSFIPKELLDNLMPLYFNPNASFKQYGIDGDVVPVVADRDGNGIIDGTDFVHLVFGMRRGGNNYYALDVTDKNTPKLLWNVTYPGFGQSWSRPVVARVDVNEPGLNSDKAVLIVGAGYDSVHDVPIHPASADSEGAGIYMLDLKSGAELWHAGRDAAADRQLSNMTRAFVSQIRVVDVSGDRLADRMYAADVSGQLWRFDISSGQTPSALVAGGVIAQFGAEGLASPTLADTRRIYNTPDVSIFSDNGRRYIAVSIGSGYRAHPLDNSASDRFYSLRDPDVFNQLTQAQYDSYPIATDADMIEVSGQLGVTLNASDRGWRFTLPATQKVLADSITFDDSIFFVAFSPDVKALSDCETTVGRNFLYRVNVVNGDPVVNNLDTLDPALADDERVHELQQGGIAPTPAILFPSPDPNCTGAACSPPPLGCVGVECFDPGFVNNPVRTLWTQDGIE
jgi:type IV pilus assembly protein PilY1